METSILIQSTPKPSKTFPTPMMLHITFDQDWLTGFRDIHVKKCEIFVIQGQINSKVSSLIQPKIKFIRPFMFVCDEVLRPVNTMRSCRAWLIYLTTLKTGQAWSSKRLTSIVHILSPETDNCPS